MQFRSILPVLSCLMLAMPAHAGDKPYRVSLIGDGFDGTWVAHPDLVSTAYKVFEDALDETIRWFRKG